MEILMEIIKSDAFLLGIGAMIIILFIGFIFLIVKYCSLNKRYKSFMAKLGNGNNIEEDLETYMYRVNKVEKQNAELTNQVENVEKDLRNCIKKVGMVRYNAFKDVGSDLSFTLALLNENDDGVVLNGIYSREMSNIYAKPIEKGKSSYTMSDEEIQAVNKAMNFGKDFWKIV